MVLGVIMEAIFVDTELETEGFHHPSHAVSRSFGPQFSMHSMRHQRDGADSL